jgi:hypothetical protein
MRAVKWTKVALVLVIPALALLLLGGSMRPPAVEAKPTGIVTITNTLCLTLTATDGDWTQDGVVNSADGAIGLSRCNTLTGAGNLRDLATVLDVPTDKKPKPEDFLPVDKDLGQLHDFDGVMYFLAFVSNDDPVTFYADEGVWASSGNATAACGPGPGYDFVDPDCDANSATEDDGIVAAKLEPGADPDRGPAIVTVRQGMQNMEEEYTIVGEPHKITLNVMEPTIQDGASKCMVMSDVATFVEYLSAPSTTIVQAIVTDDDGTPITGGLVAFETDDESKATMAKPLTPTVDMQALGIGAPNTLCGTVDSGTVTVRAAITDGVKELGPGLDPGANVGKDMEAEVTIQGMPTDMALTATPGSLVCDGTASSNVSAALTDAGGKPAMDGTPVRFSAKALGIVSPIEAKSVSGAATTALTPLSGVAKGVAVRATMALEPIDWEDVLDNYRDLIDPVVLNDLELNDKLISWRNIEVEELPLADVQLEGSLLVQCTESAAEPAVPVAPTAPAISPPATGDGGYSSGSQATSWSLALPLGLGVALLAGGLALRRRAP